MDEYNGKFGVTPEYPNGTYAYFMTEDSSGNPVYPYAIGRRFYGVPLFEGDTVPSEVDVFPSEAEGEVILTDSGTVSYVRMTKKGDNLFWSCNSKNFRWTGNWCNSISCVQTVTGLSLLNW